MTKRPDTPELATVEAADKRARFWERECKKAEAATSRAIQSRDQWRAYALALGREYLTELGHLPGVTGPGPAGPDETTE